MWQRAGLVLVSKTDLLPYVDFDLGRCAADLAKISPGATVMPVSTRTGDGIAPWVRLAAVRDGYAQLAG